MGSHSSLCCLTLFISTRILSLGAVTLWAKLSLALALEIEERERVAEAFHFSLHNDQGLSQPLCAREHQDSSIHELQEAQSIPALRGESRALPVELAGHREGSRLCHLKAHTLTCSICAPRILERICAS